jgi:hypothetical protein
VLDAWGETNRSESGDTVPLRRSNPTFVSTLARAIERPLEADAS